MIEREKTAIRRSSYSRPMRIGIGDGIIDPDSEVFDYGCGQGDDLRHLEQNGFKAFGWDPVHRPDGMRRAADVVNLGYVVNVVESPHERADVLKSAWIFARKALVVAARLKTESDTDGFSEFEDGWLTRLNTFQKFYEQQELRDWIAGTLGEEPVAACPGVFYVFRDPGRREQFLAGRYRRRMAQPRVRVSDRMFEEHRVLLEPLTAFFSDRGRLPEPEELPHHGDLCAVFGSIRRAFRVVRRVSEANHWEILEKQRKTDLLVYLALGRFPRRPKFAALPRLLQLDIRSHFGTYKRGCDAGDELLFQSGNMALVDRTCATSTLGKVMPQALYIHTSALDHLPPVLRVYEGCAKVLAGVLDGTTIIKMRRDEPKISYLCYPDFDSDPHPPLRNSLRVDLRTFHLKVRDFQQSENPPILHRKELFVDADYSQRAVFASLTKMEEEAGLFVNPAKIGTRQAWEDLLRNSGVRLDGHILIAGQGDAEAEP